MKHCVLLDSSFLVATISKGDVFHHDAVYIFRKILENKRDVRIVVPSLVFYETIVTLYKKSESKTKIEKWMWKFLRSDLIINVSQIETGAFKMCDKIKYPQIAGLKTQDFIISSVGMDYQAQILTFDKEIRKRIWKIYKDIYYCSVIGNMEDETPLFLSKLYDKIGRNNIDINEIPF